jgi:LPXTG-motif cell wall-anchored protein
MSANHLDAIIGLTNGPAWTTNDNPEEGDLNGHFEYFVGSSTAAAVSGYPGITVPAGYYQGLPLGIAFIGPRWGEPKLLGLAYDYEQATHVRVPPQLEAQGGGQPGMPRTGDNNESFLTVMFAFGMLSIGMGALIRSRRPRSNRRL